MCTLALLSLKATNHSPGALDNASGLGLLGSTAFSRRHLDDLADLDQKVFVVNLDGTGVGSWIQISCGGKSGELVGKLQKAALDEGLTTLGQWGVVGLVADHVPFTRSGIDAVTLSGLSPKLLKVHTRSDRKELLEADAMQRRGRLVLRFLDGLD